MRVPPTAVSKLLDELADMRALGGQSAYEKRKSEKNDVILAINADGKTSFRAPKVPW